MPSCRRLRRATSDGERSGCPTGAPPAHGDLYGNHLAIPACIDAEVNTTTAATSRASLPRPPRLPSATCLSPAAPTSGPGSSSTTLTVRSSTPSGEHAAYRGTRDSRHRHAESRLTKSSRPAPDRRIGAPAAARRTVQVPRAVLRRQQDLGLQWFGPSSRQVRPSPASKAHCGSSVNDGQPRSSSVQTERPPDRRRTVRRPLRDGHPQP